LENLKKKIISGLKVNTLLDFGSQLLQIIFTAFLARLLSKGDFGIVAMALIVNRFLQTITNVGFGGAIIRSKEVTDGQVTAVFYIQGVLNLALSVIIFSSADLVANFFKEEKLISIIQVTSWVIFLSTFQFPSILLQRSLEFKKLAIFQIIAMLLSNVIAVIMAFMGFGLWSLVIRLLLQISISNILLWWVVTWRPQKPDFKGIETLMIFGFNMLGSNIVYYFAENLIAILTGKYLGKETLGLFNIAYNLAIVPAQKIKSILTSVLTPGFAKFQDEMVTFTNINRQALSSTSFIFIPLMCVVSGMSNNIITFIYGNDWIGAGFMLMILSLVSLLKGISHLLRSTILAKGKADVVLYSTIIEVIFSVPIMYILMEKFDLHGLLFGFVVGNIVATIYTVYHYDKLFSDKKFFIRIIYKPFLIGCVLFIGTYFISFFELKLAYSLIIQLVLALNLFLIGLFYLNHELFIRIFSRFKNYFLRENIQ
jgi:PST family polysaccharide transporter